MRTTHVRDRARGAAFSALTLASWGAAATTPDGAARALHASAMGEDYLRTDFAAAEKKLLQALAMCGGEACARATLATLQVGLGTLAFAQQGPEVARAHFAAALQYDAGATLDPDLASAEMQRAFEETRATSAARVEPALPEPAPPVAPQAARGPAPDAEDCPPAFPGCDARDARDRPVAGEGGPTSAISRRNWVSLAFQQDVLALTSSSDACAGGSGYTCFRGDGGYYGDIPLRGADNAVNGGLAPATRRVMIGYDRALGESFSVGARLGFAFGGGPNRPSGTRFLPLHAEVRGAYWFGRTPHARVGLRPFVLLAAGAAEVDASVKVNVYADAGAYDRGAAQELQAWKKTGLGFAAVGAGAMLALAPATGVTLECRAMEMFPRPTPAIGLQVGYVIGL